MAPHGRFIALFWLFLSLGSSVRASIYDIPLLKNVHPLVHKGTCNTVLSNDLQTVYCLGGQECGIVNRVILTDSSSFVEKHYQKLLFFNNDLNNFSILNQAMKNSTIKQDDLSIVKVLDIDLDKMTLKLEDLQGETISSVYRRITKQEQPLIGDTFASFYNGQLSQLKDSILKLDSKTILDASGSLMKVKILDSGRAYNIEEPKLDMLHIYYTLTDENGVSKKYCVSFKGNNFLLTEKGVIKLIDPY